MAEREWASWPVVAPESSPATESEIHAARRRATRPLLTATSATDEQAGKSLRRRTMSGDRWRELKSYSLSCSGRWFRPCLLASGPRKKRRRGETLWPKQTPTGLGPFQFSLDFLFAAMKIDGAWSVRKPRSFTRNAQDATGAT